MFKRSMPMLDPVSFFFNEKVIVANKNDTVAAALLAAGITTFSLGTNEKTHRAPVCMIGNCFECLVEIDGQADRVVLPSGLPEGEAPHPSKKAIPCTLPRRAGAERPP